MSARLAPFLQASAFAFRSFPLLFRLPLAFAPLGNKRHHHHQQYGPIKTNQRNMDPH